MSAGPDEREWSAGDGGPRGDQARRALGLVRLVWVLLLTGEIWVAALAVAWTARLDAGAGPARIAAAGGGSAALLLSAITASVAVLVGLYWREQTFKSHWVGEAVSVRGFVIGSLLWLAWLELAVAAGVGGMLAAGRIWPELGVPIVAAGLHAASWPASAPLGEAANAGGDDGAG